MRRTLSGLGRPRLGVTLLEVAIVATLAGIMLGVFVPKIRTYQSGASIDGAAYEVARDLGRTRMEAVRRNQKVIFTRLADTAYQVGDEPPRRLPVGVKFHEPTSAESITFNAMGLAADGASHIKLKAASVSRTVVIRGSGHVSVQ
jgi:hypothetical protein